MTGQLGMRRFGAGVIIALSAFVFDTIIREHSVDTVIRNEQVILEFKDDFYLLSVDCRDNQDCEESILIKDDDLPPQGTGSSRKIGPLGRDYVIRDASVIHLMNIKTKSTWLSIDVDRLRRSVTY